MTLTDAPPAAAPLTARLFPVPAGVTTGASFSPDGAYRYHLTRQWDGTLPRLVVIGMNPSGAAADRDDATVRKLYLFARRRGYGALDMLNAYAYRATSPRDLREAADPVGPENDPTIRAIVLYALMARPPGAVLAAWGVIERSRDQALRALLRDLGAPAVCLGTTRERFPRHPLYAPMGNGLAAFDLDARVAA